MWASCLVAPSLQEAGRLQLLRHPNVVGFFGVSVDGSKGLLLMEYCEGELALCPTRLTIACLPRIPACMPVERIPGKHTASIHGKRTASIPACMLHAC